MDIIKKFAKELSVFGLVIVIFLGLFAYRQMTFKNYKTIDEKQLTSMVNNKEDFVVVLGNSEDMSVRAFQETMQTFTTKNRSIPLYYVDSKDNKKFDQYVKDTFDTNVTYPATLVIKDGKVDNKKEGPLQYYALYDFIKESLDK